jgi:hypothetical protein
LRVPGVPVAEAGWNCAAKQATSAAIWMVVDIVFMAVSLPFDIA